MKARLLLGGIKSYVPWLCDFTGTGGTLSPRYCYSVWLRHLALMHAHRLDTNPRTLVELGPGDSIGVGLAAMLTGAERYLALDVVQHADHARNAAVLEALLPLVRARAPIPAGDEFPLLRPNLPSYEFPHGALPAARLARALEATRVEAIRSDVPRTAHASGTDARIRYVVPWDDPRIVEPGAADLVLSHVALQDVAAPGAAYRSMADWLRPGGVMSHQIDFSSGDATDAWNAHWTYPDLAWRVVRGRRPYYINRLPLSAHLRLLGEAGFAVVAVTRSEDTHGVPRARLARSFRSLSDEDLATSAAHILAVKR